jgi:WD40 repeat protein
MTDVIRNIFSRLDEESLRQAELVSKLWRKVICEECIWKFILRNKVFEVHEFNC